MRFDKKGAVIGGIVGALVGGLSGVLKNLMGLDTGSAVTIISVAVILGTIIGGDYTTRLENVLNRRFTKVCIDGGDCWSNT
ncbi:hypothetical protein DRO69_08635 [Candidatus Bathyarchaeota archaeon]|nr:MAG: hypothetical protein DRO69_08635 [Candidatus Bathyarchaeota archaeon]